MLEDQGFAAPQNPLATLDGADLASYGASNPFVSNATSAPAAPRPEVSASAPSFLGVAPGIDTSGFSPDFGSKLSAFQAAAKAAGVDTSIISGFRTKASQAELYANYKAGQAGEPLPYPARGPVHLAAPPGTSPHEVGIAADVHALDPKKQGWLDENAPKFGLTSGSDFGDPGHYQLAGVKGNSRAGEHPSAINTPTPAAASQDSGSPPASVASGAPNPKGLFTLALLQALAPMHKFSPVDYDPFKVMPK